MNWTG